MKCLKYIWKLLKSKISWSLFGLTVQGRMIISKKLTFSDVKLIFLMLWKKWKLGRKRKKKKLILGHYAWSFFSAPGYFNKKIIILWSIRFLKVGQKLILIIYRDLSYYLLIYTFSLVPSIIFECRYFNYFIKKIKA